MSTIGLTTKYYTDPARSSWTDRARTGAAARTGRSVPGGAGPREAAEPPEHAPARPMTTHLWYPAAPGSATTEIMIGPKDAPYFHAGTFAPDAEPAHAARPRPLAVLSHASGGSALQLAWLAAALVDAGFLVAGVNHHGNTAIESYSPEGFLYWWHRPLDLSRVVDRLLADPVFGSGVDADGICTAGFSYGGFTGLLLGGGTPTTRTLAQFCESERRDAACETPPEFADREDFAIVREGMRRAGDMAAVDPPYSGMDLEDPRFRAAVALSPPLGGAFLPEDFRRIAMPVWLIVPERDPMAPKENNAGYMAAHIAGAELTVLPGVAGHHVFMSEATEAGRRARPFVCQDPPGVDRRAIHKEIAPQAARFLLRALGK